MKNTKHTFQKINALALSFILVFSQTPAFATDLTAANQQQQNAVSVDQPQNSDLAQHLGGVVDELPQDENALSSSLSQTNDFASTYPTETSTEAFVEELSEGLVPIGKPGLLALNSDLNAASEDMFQAALNDMGNNLARGVFSADTRSTTWSWVSASNPSKRYNLVKTDSDDGATWIFSPEVLKPLGRPGLLALNPRLNPILNDQFQAALNNMGNNLARGVFSADGRSTTWSWTNANDPGRRSSLIKTWGTWNFSPRVSLSADQSTLRFYNPRLNTASYAMFNAALYDMGRNLRNFAKHIWSADGLNEIWTWVGTSDPTKSYRLVQRTLPGKNSVWSFYVRQRISWNEVRALANDLRGPEKGSFAKAIRHGIKQGAVPVLIRNGNAWSVQWKDKTYHKAMLLNADGTIKKGVSVPEGLDLKALLSNPNLVVTVTKRRAGMFYCSLTLLNNPNKTYQIVQDSLNPAIINVSTITHASANSIRALLLNEDGTLKEGVTLPAEFKHVAALAVFLENPYLKISSRRSATGVRYILNDPFTSLQIGVDRLTNSPNPITTISYISPMTAASLRAQLLNTEGTLKEGVTLPAEFKNAAALATFLANPYLKIRRNSSASGVSYQVSIANDPLTNLQIIVDQSSNTKPPLITISYVRRIPLSKIRERFFNVDGSLKGNILLPVGLEARFAQILANPYMVANRVSIAGAVSYQISFPSNPWIIWNVSRSALGEPWIFSKTTHISRHDMALVTPVL